MILALKTDTDPVEIYVLSESGQVLREKKWRAERTLAKLLLGELKTILEGDFSGLTGLVVFSGPGSFTGLRIGVTVLNTIAYSENIPIVDVGGKDWLKKGLQKLRDGKNNRIVVPDYGAEANITKPRK